MKIYKFTGLILGFLIASAFNANSQVLDFSEEKLDSLVAPGALFKTDEVRSTGAAATVSGAALYRTATPNLTNTFSGKLPGLFTISSDGTPGGNNAIMYVRGIGSYAQSTGTTTLKFYVDGFEVDSDYIAYLNPEEIATVSVLKDAADLATLGMSGANGAIWIETKRGMNSEQPVITFQARSGVQNPINVAKPLRSYDYAYLYNQAVSNDNGMIWSPLYSDSQLSDYKSGRGVDVGWYDEIYKNNGMYSDASLSFRGGSQTVNYFVLLDYANQQGLLNVKNTDKTKNVTFAKYGVRTNFDIKFNSVFTVSFDIGGRLEDRTSPNYSTYNLTQDVINYPSNIYPIFDELSEDPISKYSGTAIYPNNPVASLSGVGWTTSRTKVLQANFKFKEDLEFLLKGLYLEEGFSFYARTIGQTGKTRTYARYFNGVAQTSDVSSYIRSNGYGSGGLEQWMQGNIRLGYDGVFDEHAVTAALNAHLSDYSGNGSQFFNNKFRYINYSGRVNYVYDKRYVAELGFSLYGSDGYAPGHRYGFYPSASLGWIVSNESFLNSSDAVKYLKLRGSVGTTAATEARVNISNFATNGRFLYRQYYASGGGFTTGIGPQFGGGSSGMVALFKANENVFAEKSLKANAGLDLNLFDKFNLNADVFMDKRDGILTLDNSIMNYYGNTIFYDNIGKMTNKGFEATLSFNDKIGDVKYSIFGSATYAKNKVEYMGEVPPKYDYNAETGRPYGTKMGLECIGYFQLHDFNADGSLKDGIPVPAFGAVQPGDLRYKDQDNDGHVDQTDIIEIGAPNYPSLAYNFGAEFSVKGFDFSVLFTGASGASVNLLASSAWQPFLDYGNAFEWAKGAWAYYPEQGIDTRKDATFPRLTLVQNDNNYRASSFWIRKNDFLRLRNVEIGYDLAGLRAIRDAGISKCRLYLNAYNPLTFSQLLKDYKMDPETTNYGYPAVKSFNFGVQISF